MDGLWNRLGIKWMGSLGPSPRQYIIKKTVFVHCKQKSEEPRFPHWELSSLFGPSLFELCVACYCGDIRMLEENAG